MQLTIKLLFTSILYTTVACDSTSLHIVEEANQQVVEQQPQNACEHQSSDLIQAIGDNNLPLLETFLLNKGIDVNTQDHAGHTPLDLALIENKTDVIKLFANHITTQSKCEGTLEPLSELIIVGKNIEEDTINWKKHAQTTGGIIIDFNRKKQK